MGKNGALERVCFANGLRPRTEHVADLDIVHKVLPVDVLCQGISPTSAAVGNDIAPVAVPAVPCPVQPIQIAVPLPQPLPVGPQRVLAVADLLARQPLRPIADLLPRVPHHEVLIPAQDTDEVLDKAHLIRHRARVVVARTWFRVRRNRSLRLVGDGQPVAAHHAAAGMLAPQPSRCLLAGQPQIDAHVQPGSILDQLFVTPKIGVPLQRLVDRPVFLELDQVKTVPPQRLHVPLEFGYGGHRLAAQVRAQGKNLGKRL